MSNYIAIDWEILKINSLEDTYHKVFITLPNREQWSLNSGIEYVKKELVFDVETPNSFNKTLNYRVFGYSGSEYVLKEGGYGIKGIYSKSVLFDILEKSNSTEYKVRRLEEDEAYKVLEKYLR